MGSLKDKYCIVGIGETEYSRSSKRSTRAMAVDAIKNAMADAGLNCWTSKYDNDFWRPILGVRNGNADTNPDTAVDPNWTPLGAAVSNGTAGQTNFTPPFPAYTSGHATFGAAMFQTLTRFYGTDHITFTFVSDEFNGVTTDAGSTTPRPLIPRGDAVFYQRRELACTFDQFMGKVQALE